MAFLTAPQAAALAQSTVRLAMLIEMQFASETKRVFNGFGILDAAGATWEGIGGLGSIDGLQQTREPTSEKVTLQLEGVTPGMVALAAHTTADVEGRPCYISNQLFDADWQAIGAPIPLYWGTMQRLIVKRTRASADGSSGGTRILKLEIENPFAGRARASGRRYTDADQKARHPGDQFCRFVPLQRSQTITWPDY